MTPSEAFLALLSGFREPQYNGCDETRLWSKHTVIWDFVKPLPGWQSHYTRSILMHVYLNFLFLVAFMSEHFDVVEGQICKTKVNTNCEAPRAKNSSMLCILNLYKVSFKAAQ